MQRSNRLVIIEQTFIVGKNLIEVLIEDIYYNLWKIKNEVYPGRK